MSRNYDNLFKTLDSLCDGESDAVALMSTIACELYSAFDDFDWVGFYRNVGDSVLKVGPYQGGHGCLTIPFEKGVCGKCARERTVQNVPDVSQIAHHIACSSTTQSELVVPVICGGDLIAVLDIDSNKKDAFDKNDEDNLQRISKYFLPAENVNR